MIVIFAEKPDVGNKIAAALDQITLSSGKIIKFKDLKANEKAVKSQQARDGFLKINYLGEECYVTWGYGHLCELKEAEDYNPDYKNWSKMPMPFIPKNFEVKVKSGCEKQFNLVRDLIAKSSLVINATDYDREGELIFAYFYEAAKLKTPFKRAHFSSQTEEGLKDGFATLLTSSEVKPITDAGRGRSIADAIFGWNITAKMTLISHSRAVLSYGRVQTPTENLLVERELAIRNFVPEAYYTISAEFTTTSKEKYKGDHKTKRFTKKADADAIISKIRGKKGTVTSIEKKSVFKEAPNLFSLSALQMAANTKYGFTMAKTLEIAQQLYEAGYTTYPRTDSQFLTEDMEPVVNEVLDSLAANNKEYADLIDGHSRIFDKKKYFDDSKVKSHFAIIPTKIYPSSTITLDQKKIYDLVARSVIMMIYGKAELENTKIITTVEGEDFISNGKMVKDPQWMLVDTKSKDEILPTLKKGDIVDGAYKLNEKMTEPPKRYTDKTLLSAMLNAGKELDDDDLKKIMASGAVEGIGTEATRASIIETLINRGYAERDKKSIYATERGIQAIQALPIKEMKSAELTAIWESRLNKIAEEKDTLDSFISDMESLINKWIDELNSKVKVGDISITTSAPVLGVCPNCGKSIIKMKWGYGCTGYKDGCKFTISNEIAHKKITDANVKKLLTKKSTGIIKGFKSSAGKSFDAELILDGNKVIFGFAKAPAASTKTFHCPKCKKIMESTTWAYKCDCGVSINKRIANKDLTDDEIEQLITKGKTNKIKGFKSKAGKTFSASIVLDKDFKTQFDFS